jgi:hypothetical protein
MGKWTHLLDSYPERKLALKSFKDLCLDMSMEELEREVARHHTDVKELKAKKSLSEQKYVAASEVLLERWREDGTQSIKREHIGLLVRNDDVRARIKDMKAFKEWAEQNDLGAIVTETVNANTLSSTMKTLLQEGVDIPDCISLFIQSRVNVTKPKGVV